MSAILVRNCVDIASTSHAVTSSMLAKIASCAFFKFSISCSLPILVALGSSSSIMVDDCTSFGAVIGEMVRRLSSLSRLRAVVESEARPESTVFDGNMSS